MGTIPISNLDLLRLAVMGFGGVFAVMALVYVSMRALTWAFPRRSGPGRGE